MACWAIGVLLAAAIAAAQDDEAWRRELVCAHHSDIRGFSLDLPEGVCGHRYLHGFSIVLSVEGTPVERSITVWAAANANFYKKSRNVAAAEVAARAPDAVSGVRVLQRAPTKVAGVQGERWRYAFRSKADGADHLVDVVAILRALRPKPRWSDYYEYSILLYSTPQHHDADLRQFEAILKCLTFTEPEI